MNNQVYARKQGESKLPDLILVVLVTAISSAANWVHELGYAEELLDKLPKSGKIFITQESLRDYYRDLEDVLNWNRKTDPIRLF